MIKTILLPCDWLRYQMVCAPLMPAAPSWFSSTCSGTGTFHLPSPSDPAAGSLWRQCGASRPRRRQSHVIKELWERQVGTENVPVFVHHERKTLTSLWPNWSELGCVSEQWGIVRAAELQLPVSGVPVGAAPGPALFISSWGLGWAGGCPGSRGWVHPRLCYPGRARGGTWPVSPSAWWPCPSTRAVACQQQIQ